MARRLALLIVTYDYQDAGLRRLTAPAHDAQALAAVLEDPRIAGLEVTTRLAKADTAVHTREIEQGRKNIVRPRQPGSRPERLDI
jgi:hypothetical protein